VPANELGPIPAPSDSPTPSTRSANAASHPDADFSLDSRANWSPASRREPRRTNTLTNFLGHIIFGMLGLLLGYFLLTLIRPDLNLHQIELPELSAPTTGNAN